MKVELWELGSWFLHETAAPAPNTATALTVQRGTEGSRGTPI